MDYEKAYKEALEKLRSLHDDYGTVSTLIDIKEELENIFPELAENEEEKIRKALIRFHKSSINIDGIKGEDIIAWLEKQEIQNIIVTDEQIHWLKWAIRRLPDTEKGNEAETVLTEFVEQLEKQGAHEQVDGFDAELNALLKKYEYLPKEEVAECLQFYLGVVRGKQKPKWTQEDEERLQSCINTLQGKGLMGGVDTVNTKWLKSLKQRML